jgi:hypothetical protein
MVTLPPRTKYYPRKTLSNKKTFREKKNYNSYTETLLSGQRSREGEAMRFSAGRVNCREVGIIFRDWNRPAFWMNRLSGIASSAVQDRIGESLKNKGVCSENRIHVQTFFNELSINWMEI